MDIETLKAEQLSMRANSFTHLSSPKELLYYRTVQLLMFIIMTLNYQKEVSRFHLTRQVYYSVYQFQDGKLKKRFYCIKWKALVIWKAHFCKQSSLMVSDSYYTFSSTHYVSHFLQISVLLVYLHYPLLLPLQLSPNYNTVY